MSEIDDALQALDDAIYLFTKPGGGHTDTGKRLIAAKAEFKACRQALVTAILEQSGAIFQIQKLQAELLNTRHGAGDGEAWRSIESAPDDGTPFLAYLPKERRTIQVGWQNKNGVMAIGSSFSFDLTPATHWRPLPAPPTDEAARAGERG